MCRSPENVQDTIPRGTADPLNPTQTLIQPSKESESAKIVDASNQVEGNLKPYYDPTLGVELDAWRNACTTSELSDRIESQEGYSVAVLGSGGLLDTIAAVRAGFIPVLGH